MGCCLGEECPAAQLLEREQLVSMGLPEQQVPQPLVLLGRQVLQARLVLERQELLLQAFLPLVQAFWPLP
jgi:hypothetical protein